MRRDVVAAQPVANLYREPSPDAEVTSQMLYGAAAEVLEARSGWYCVRTADTYTGWVESASVLPHEQTATGSAAKLIVAVNSANIYGAPDVKHRPLLNLPWESRIAALPEAEVARQLSAAGLGEAEAARWTAVRLLDGRDGFVMRGNVAVSLPRLTLLESIAAAAQRFPGVTYTWGGVSSYGFDCSGFVQMIFRQCGVTLPRDAALQAEWVGLRTVDDGQPELGDVVFFGPEAGVVDHVGVSLGGMRFLHDTTRGVPGVQIGALDEARWRERFLLRRRLIA